MPPVPAEAVMVYVFVVKVTLIVWAAVTLLNETDPEGEMVPPVPADAVMVYVLTANVALIVCAAITLLNIYELIAPWDTPSTATFAIW